MTQTEPISQDDNKRINIVISAKLLKEVDEFAKSKYATRSDIIRQALLEKIHRPTPDLDELIERLEAVRRQAVNKYHSRSAQQDAENKL